MGSIDRLSTASVYSLAWEIQAVSLASARQIPSTRESASGNFARNDDWTPPCSSGLQTLFGLAQSGAGKLAGFLEGTLNSSAAAVATPRALNTPIERGSRADFEASRRQRNREQDELKQIAETDKKMASGIRTMIGLLRSMSQPQVAEIN